MGTTCRLQVHGFKDRCGSTAKCIGILPITATTRSLHADRCALLQAFTFPMLYCASIAIALLLALKIPVNLISLD